MGNIIRAAGAAVLVLTGVLASCSAPPAPPATTISPECIQTGGTSASDAVSLGAEIRDATVGQQSRSVTRVLCPGTEDWLTFSWADRGEDLSANCNYFQAFVITVASDDPSLVWSGTRITLGGQQYSMGSGVANVPTRVTVWDNCGLDGSFQGLVKITSSLGDGAPALTYTLTVTR